MKRRTLFTFGLLLWGVAPGTSAAPGSSEGATYVIVHGAWGGGWAWREVAGLLTARGHEVYRPTLTGLGERRHLVSPELGLATHIEDVVNTFLFEELNDVVLVGHSYGGMVISGVAERVPERIRHLVYLDAFVPENGESVMGNRSVDAGGGDWLRKMVQDGLVVPPWVRPDQPLPHDVPQSLKTFTDIITLTNEKARQLPATYILTMEAEAERDDFSAHAERAKQRGWTVRQLEADHNPQWSKPKPLTELLDACSRQDGR